MQVAGLKIPDFNTVAVGEIRDGHTRGLRVIFPIWLRRHRVVKEPSSVPMTDMSDLGITNVVRCIPGQDDSDVRGAGVVGGGKILGRVRDYLRIGDRHCRQVQRQGHDEAGLPDELGHCAHHVLMFFHNLMNESASGSKARAKRRKDERTRVEEKHLSSAARHTREKPLN